jgi:hypothetical protein
MRFDERLMFRTTFQMFVLAVTGLALACGSNVSPTAPSIGDSDVVAASENKKGGPPPGATYSVELRLGADPAPAPAGTLVSAVANRKGSGFDSTDMSFDVGSLNTPNVGDVNANCEDFALAVGDKLVVHGQFAANGDKNFAALHDFEVNGERHYIDLRPATIKTNWLPEGSGDVGVLSGDQLAIQANKGQVKRGACDTGIITHAWEIKATRN